MSDHQSYPGEADGQVTATVEHSAPGAKNGRHREEHNHPVARVAVDFLDNGDSIIYAIVGTCFLAGGLIALGYAFWDFINTIAINWPINPSHLVSAIIQFVSDLLLVLIIMEVLGTVTHYLQSHTTSLRPFLFIGIVSATRGILSIGAKLSVESQRPAGTDFRDTMVELGVNAAVILALGITLKLLGRLVED